MEVGETAGDDDHSSQHHTQIQLKQGEMVQFIWGVKFSRFKVQKRGFFRTPEENCESKLSNSLQFMGSAHRLHTKTDRASSFKKEAAFAIYQKPVFYHWASRG